MNFLAIDFETANQHRHSACAVGLVKVKDGKIVDKKSYLIRPPTKYFSHWNVNVHGLRWNDVKESPTFEELWPKIRKCFRGVDYIAAHNAWFDRDVLHECCDYYGIIPPNKSFVCTCQISKKLWGLNHGGLAYVCEHFNIPLNHHEALSDSLACAKILLKAKRNNKLQDVMKFY